MRRRKRVFYARFSLPPKIFNLGPGCGSLTRVQWLDLPGGLRPWKLQFDGPYRHWKQRRK